MDNIHNYNYVYDKLRNIFNSRFGMNLDDMAKENFDKYLLGSVFKLAPRDLVYIYLDIEKDFDISIPDEDVANGGLSTINNIIQIIETWLQKNKKDAV